MITAFSRAALGVIGCAALLAAGRVSAGNEQRSMAVESEAAPSPPRPSNTFVKDPDLAVVERLIAQGRFDQAQERATQLLVHPPSRPPKKARWLRAGALYARARAAALSGEDSAARLPDLEAAAALGDRQAAHEAGRLHAGAAARAKSPAERKIAGRAAFRYCGMAADLGDQEDQECTKFIAWGFRQYGRTVDARYWELMAAIDRREALRDLGPIEALVRQWSIAGPSLDQIMRERSVSGGAQPPRAPLPGRSALGAAFVDVQQRHMLELSWRSFYDESAEDATLAESIAGALAWYSKHPLLTAYLVMATPLPPGEPGIQVANPAEMASYVLPGDTIFVRCGVNSHRALVWSVFPDSGGVLLLDPFPEFWETCHTTIERTPYRYQRELIALFWPEVEPNLVAVITQRDRS